MGVMVRAGVRAELRVGGGRALGQTWTQSSFRVSSKRGFVLIGKRGSFHCTCNRYPSTSIPDSTPSHDQTYRHFISTSTAPSIAIFSDSQYRPFPSRYILPNGQTPTLLRRRHTLLQGDLDPNFRSQGLDNRQRSKSHPNPVSHLENLDRDFQYWGICFHALLAQQVWREGT